MTQLGKRVSDMYYRRLGKGKQSLYNSFLTSESGLPSVSVTFDFQPSVSRFTSKCMCTVQVVFSDESIIQCKDQRVQYVRRMSGESVREDCVIQRVKHPMQVHGVECHERVQHWPFAHS